MEEKNVTAAEKNKDRTITLIITDPITKITSKKRYVAVRGGIAWPSATSPGYFCIIGQEYIKQDPLVDKTEAGRWFLLAEGEGSLLSMARFYREICDRAVQMLCRRFYAELPDDRWECGYLNDLEDVADKCDSSLSVHQGETAEDYFVQGLSRIHMAMEEDRLPIPDDSILYSQLRSITVDELANHPENNFYAITALTHVLGDFLRFKPKPMEPYRMPPPPDWRAV